LRKLHFGLLSILFFFLQKDIFPDISIDEVELRIKKTDQTVDDLADIRISENDIKVVYAIVTKRFIANGGFTKAEKLKIKK